MSTPFARARLGAAVVVAFFSGLVFASAFDLTRFGWAQGRTGVARPTAQEVKPLADASSAFVSISEHVTPAVVSIQTERTAPARPGLRGRGQLPPGMEELFRNFELPERQAPQEGRGSGFIVSRDGYILTNNHVVADADRVIVTLLDKRSFPARVIGRDPTTDVAVIKVEANGLPTASFGDDVSSRVGEWVLAIGNPLGLDFTVTAGIISAKGRGLDNLPNATNYAIQDFIQTDAPINPGNSGGPLVNIRGEVIGINSAIASQTGFYAGYGFAVPIGLARRVMEDLIAHGRVRRAILGISLGEVTQETARAAGLEEIRGAAVFGFNPTDASPAQRAGMEPGDVIVAVDGRSVDRVSTLQRIVRDRKPGETVSVQVMRFGKRMDFKVRLAQAPDAEQTVAEAPARARPIEAPGRSSAKLGITVSALPAEIAQRFEVGAPYRQGLYVTDVEAGGASYRTLRSNEHIILRVLNPAPARDVRSVADLEGAVGSLKRGDLLTLLVYDLRRRGTEVLTIRIAQ